MTQRLSQEWLFWKKTEISLLCQEKGKNPGPNPDMFKSRNPDSIGSDTCELMRISYFLSLN